MSTRYLIGKGELLTYPIAAPKKKPTPKSHPYSLGEAQSSIIPQIETASQTLQQLPSKACPDDLAVARLTLHPAYIAKSFFPKQLLDYAGLTSIGSRTRRVRPRKMPRGKNVVETETTELFVAANRNVLRNLPDFARQLTQEMPVSEQFIEIEEFAPMLAHDRIRTNNTSAVNMFEVGLHLPPEGMDINVRDMFADFASDYGFKVNEEFDFRAGRLLFLAVEGDSTGLEALANFSLMRVVRAMPTLRSLRPSVRSTAVSVGFSLPNVEPISREPKVAILDGGLPSPHILGDYVRRYFIADATAHDVEDYLAHGLAVSSAVLFGPIVPGERAARPYAAIDHHRVLDAVSDIEDPLELYRTLSHIETVLMSRQYQFINLSLGPDRGSAGNRQKNSRFSPIPLK